MRNETKLYLIRHGESAKYGFPGRSRMTPEELEMNKDITNDARHDSKKLGVALSDDLGDLHDLKLQGYVSGKQRSFSTLAWIYKGLFPDARDLRSSGTTAPELIYYNAFTSDSDLTYILDERYVKAAKKSVQMNDYLSTVDFFLDNEPERFFREGGITDPKRTQSAYEMQRKMKGAIRRTIDTGLYGGVDVSLAVSHEPCLSLVTVDLSGLSVGELGGKYKELEYSQFVANKPVGSQYPEIAMVFRGKEYDIGQKIYDL